MITAKSDMGVITLTAPELRFSRMYGIDCNRVLTISIGKEAHCQTSKAGACVTDADEVKRKVRRDPCPNGTDIDVCQDWQGLPYVVSRKEIEVGSKKHTRVNPKERNEG